MQQGVIDFLRSYSYPGNIRELRNIIERLIVLSEDGEVRFEDLPEVRKNCLNEISNLDEIIPLKEFRKSIEKDYIIKVLRKCDGSITKSAIHLKISKRQLFNKISEYDIK